MPMKRYASRRTRKYRSQASRNKRNATMKRGAKAQQKQILSLQRQVNATKQKLDDRIQYAQFFSPLEQGTGQDQATVELPDNLFYVSNLMRPSSWEAIFQTTNAAEQSNKAIIRNFDIQLVFSPKNSITGLTPRIVRVWCLSLKPETAQDTLNGTGAMSTTGLNNAANGLYYKNTFVTGGLATMVKFNPASYKIHHYREFTVANILEETAVPDEDTAVTNTKDALKRVRIRWTCGNKLKPGTGVWSNMSEQEIMPKDRKYLVVHVGGWANDEDNGIIMDTNIVVQTRATN